jgi:DNA-3-methyladenine glycosylase II
MNGMTSRARRPRATTIEDESDIARGVRSLKRRCPVMRRIHTATGDPPLRRRPPGFEGLGRIIIGQQVSVASANAIWARCQASITPFAPQTVIELSDDHLRAAGLSRPKMRTLRAISTAVVEDGLDLVGFGGADDAGIHEALCAIKGVGPWTADIYLMFCLGRPDAFAPGDLALQVAAQHAFDLSERPSANELFDLAESWRPWRGVSARMLWAYHHVLKNRASQPM